MPSKWRNIPPLDRWKPTSEHLISYKTFREYECELLRIIRSFESGKGYTYHHLKTDGAEWSSKAFDFGLSHTDHSLDVKQWVHSYEEFGNWFRLSLLMSMSSMLETYLACMIRECIESDPGLLIGSSKSIDGMSLLLRKVN